MKSFIQIILAFFLITMVSQGETYASELLLKNCQIIPISACQIVTEGDKHYILDENSNSFVPIQGFVHLNNQSFAIRGLNSVELEVDFWEETWECPTCGYDNYSSIGTCPICGTKKPRK